jgi:hypothetical protein
MKKVISFTLFGYEPKYYIGAEKNVEVNQTLLPDWNTVIYYHPEMTRMDSVEKLSSMGATLIDVSDIIIGNKTPKDFPFFWRFLAFLNDDITLVRDLDSRVSDREVEYINRWLKNGKDYFIIRDHPWHSPVPSGLYGIKGKKVEFENHFNSFVGNSDLRWGTDQEILHEYMKDIPLENVEYCGFDRPETYIPRVNKEFFIGMQLDENDNPTVPSGETCLNYLKELNL